MKDYWVGTNICIGIPTTNKARRSPTWIDSLASLQFPLGSGANRIWVADKPIAEARNEIITTAMKYDAHYVFMLGDDVIPPHNAVITLLDKIGRKFPVDGEDVKADMVTGVYWTKTYPSEPYLYNGILEGPCRKWNAGDFFPVDLAGCDCLLIDMEMIKKIPYPWFSTDWVFKPGDRESSLTTEDFYFYSKARSYGYRLFADTGIECYHEDRSTGMIYGLTTDMAEAGGISELEEWRDKGELIAADLGAGTWSPQWPENIKVMRFDIRKDISIDVSCDLENIPEMYFGRFDIVQASHVLEHFPRRTVKPLLEHWVRLLKPKGKLIIRVPNVMHAFKVIEKAVANPGTVHPEDQGYAWAQLYGDQRNYEHSMHKTGFTKETFTSLLKSIRGLGFVEVEYTEGDELNLCGTATLVGDAGPEVLTRDYWPKINFNKGGDSKPTEEKSNGTSDSQNQLGLSTTTVERPVVDKSHDNGRESAGGRAGGERAYRDS